MPIGDIIQLKVAKWQFFHAIYYAYSSSPTLDRVELSNLIKGIKICLHWHLRDPNTFPYVICWQVPSRFTGDSRGACQFFYEEKCI